MRAKPQWSSKVIINCDKHADREIMHEDAADGIEEKLTTKSPETGSSLTNYLQNSFLKRSKSELTPDREKVEVGSNV